MRQWGDIKIMAASEYNIISQDPMYGMLAGAVVVVMEAMVREEARVEEVVVEVVYTHLMMDREGDILQEDLQTLLMF